MCVSRTQKQIRLSEKLITITLQSHCKKVVSLVDWMTLYSFIEGDH